MCQEECCAKTVAQNNLQICNLFVSQFVFVILSFVSESLSLTDATYTFEKVVGNLFFSDTDNQLLTTQAIYTYLCCHHLCMAIDFFKEYLASFRFPDLEVIMNQHICI